MLRSLCVLVTQHQCTLVRGIAFTQGLPWDAGPWSSRTGNPISGSSHSLQSVVSETGTCEALPYGLTVHGNSVRGGQACVRC